MPNPTPQQNQIVAPQQKMDTEVMDLIQRKGSKDSPDQLQQAKKRLATVIKQFNIDPQKIVKAGEYAKQALLNPQMYPMALEVAVREGILTPDQVPKGKEIDYGLLASGITAGKLAKMLIDEGGV